MLINEKAIFKMYEEGKIKDQKDLGEVVNAVLKEIIEGSLHPPEIRRLIYTTNPIESFNTKFKRVTKNKGVFPTKDSLFKLLYLAIEDIAKKWTGTIRNWSKIYPRAFISFEDRINTALNPDLYQNEDLHK